MNARTANSYDFVQNDFLHVSIDYLLAKHDNFEKICKFIICNFTTCSDHAPVHIHFKTNVLTQTDFSNLDITDGEEAKVFKWNSKHKDLCYNALLSVICAAFL